MLDSAPEISTSELAQRLTLTTVNVVGPFGSDTLLILF